MNQTRDLREFSQLEKDIAEAEEDFKKGRYITLEKLLTQMKRQSRMPIHRQSKNGKRSSVYR